MPALVHVSVPSDETVDRNRRYVCTFIGHMLTRQRMSGAFRHHKERDVRHLLTDKARVLQIVLRLFPSHIASGEEPAEIPVPHRNMRRGRMRAHARQYHEFFESAISSQVVDTFTRLLHARTVDRSARVSAVTRS